MQDEMDAKCEDLVMKASKTTVSAEDKEEVERMIRQLKPKNRIVAVLDFDMFYCAVALLKYPQYKNKPVVITEGGNDQTVVTCNYVARQYGIGKGMNFWEARQRSPVYLHKLQKDEEMQAKVSRMAVDIYRQYDDTCEPSLQDEATLELGPYLMKTFGEMTYEYAEKVVQEMRDKVFEATGCTLSAGISSNFMMGKLASELKKPNGQSTLKPQEFEEFLKPLPIRKLPGIGPATEQHLKHAFEVSTVGDLKLSLPKIVAVNYKAVDMIKYSIGFDEEVNKPRPLPKQVCRSSNRATSKCPLSGNDLKEAFEEVCNKVAAGMVVERVNQSTKQFQPLYMSAKEGILHYTAGYLPCSRKATNVSLRSATDLMKTFLPLLQGVKSVSKLSLEVTKLEKTQKRTLESFLAK